MPGRLQVLGERPLTVLDGAHNPDAIVELVRSLPEVLAGGRLGLVMGVLEDKDAASMLAALLPVCARAWFTAPPSPRALSPAALQSLARQLGFDAVECEPQPERALDGARLGRGSARGRGRCSPRARSTWSAICCAGRSASATMPGAQAGSQRSNQMNDDGPSVLTMIGAVALIVALVILVFFAAGYGFGRLFL